MRAMLVEAAVRFGGGLKEAGVNVAGKRGFWRGAG